MLHLSNDDLNLEELEYFAKNYDESLSNEYEIEETGEYTRNIFYVFEFYISIFLYSC